MPTSTTFIVSGWVERHYQFEIEASSFEEAEEIAERRLNYSDPSELYDCEDGTLARISNVECQDPHWDEFSEEDEAC